MRHALAICALLSIGSAGCSFFSRPAGDGKKPPDGAATPSRPARPPVTAAPGAPSVPEATPIDRVVVRWYAPETGGVTKPQFVFARELAFEARLEALIDPDPDSPTYRDRHVRAALDRHIAETLLASLTTVPEPSAGDIEKRAASARAILEQRVGGRGQLLAAAAAEGVSEGEIDTMLRRQARASLYLDRMVTPMLEPTEPELLALHRTGQTPFSNKPFEDVQERLKRWYVGARLSQALDTYYQNARSRVTIAIVKKP